MRDGERAGLAVEEGKGELGLRLPNTEREEDEGGSGESGASAGGMVAVGDECGDRDLRLAKEVERKREGRLGWIGACIEMERKRTL